MRVVSVATVALSATLVASSVVRAESSVDEQLLQTLQRIEARLASIETRLAPVDEPPAELTGQEAYQAPITVEAVAKAEPIALAEGLKPGGLVIFRPMGKDLGTISPDRVGGLVYDGQPLDLSDLPELGVSYHHIPTVELAGWLPIHKAGRYQFIANIGMTGRGRQAQCVMRLWLEGQQAAEVEAADYTGIEPVTLTLSAGLGLTPGLHRFQAWLGCDSQDNVFKLHELRWYWLEPGQLNTRLLQPADLQHQG